MDIQNCKLNIFSYRFENIPFVFEHADSTVFQVFAHLCQSLPLISYYPLIELKCVSG